MHRGALAGTRGFRGKNKEKRKGSQYCKQENSKPRASAKRKACSPTHHRPAILANPAKRAAVPCTPHHSPSITSLSALPLMHQIIPHTHTSRRFDPSRGHVSAPPRPPSLLQIPFEPRRTNRLSATSTTHQRTIERTFEAEVLVDVGPDGRAAVVAPPADDALVAELLCGLLLAP
eukprot:3341175-Rhodomonas_salina.2